MMLGINDIPHCGQSPVEIRMSSSTHPFSKSSPAGFLRERNTVSLGRNWKLYHGSNNWDGLLNPLDDTLRAEILRYGRFVEATYNSFNFDPTSPSYASSLYPRDKLLPLTGLPDTGYVVSRDLHSSSGIQLPSWVDTAPSWMTNPTSWIGYVAVCQDEDAIRRLGRRDVVIALRGTTTCMEWLENLRATLARIPPGGAHCDEECDVMVQRGFWSLYASTGAANLSLQNQIRDEVGRLLDAYGRDGVPLSITLTGHSLGAALALLSAYDVATTFRHRSPHIMTVISFGGPRVGNARFRRQVEDLGIKVLRIVNTRDIVTKVPGYVVDGRSPCWLSRAGLAYSDVGQELTVSCSSRNMVACHDLSVYLQLVKHLRANCPFTGKTKAPSGHRRLRWPSLFKMPMAATR